MSMEKKLAQARQEGFEDGMKMGEAISTAVLNTLLTAISEKYSIPPKELDTLGGKVLQPIAEGCACLGMEVAEQSGSPLDKVMARRQLTLIQRGDMLLDEWRKRKTNEDNEDNS